jgi:hypothetical protein
LALITPGVVLLGQRKSYDYASDAVPPQAIIDILAFKRKFFAV